MARMFRRGIKGGLWSAAVCVEARQAAILLRESLDGLDYAYSRDMTHRPFTKFMVVLPWPRFAYVFQFKVHEPAHFTLNVYDIQPTTTGGIHMLEVKGVDASSIKSVVRLMRDFSRRLGRRPYDFDPAERMRTGYLLGEFTSARRLWNSVGVA
jgi:hypothetical protein